MATHPYDTMLEYSTNIITPSYTELTKVRAITPPNIDIGVTETTHLRSTDATKERIRSWKDPTEIPFRTEYTDALYTALQTLAKKNPSADLQYWRVSLPLASGQTNRPTFVALAFISHFGLTEGSVDSDDDYEIEVTLTISGYPTFTAGS